VVPSCEPAAISDRNNRPAALPRAKGQASGRRKSHRSVAILRGVSGKDCLRSVLLLVMILLPGELPEMQAGDAARTETQPFSSWFLVRRRLWSAPLSSGQPDRLSPRLISGLQTGQKQVLVTNGQVLINDDSGVRMLDLQTGHPVWESAEWNQGHLLPLIATTDRIPVSTAAEPRFHRSGCLAGSAWWGLVSGSVMQSRLDRDVLVQLDFAAQGRLQQMHRAPQLAQAGRVRFAGAPAALSGGRIAIPLRKPAEPDVWWVTCLNSAGDRVWSSEPVPVARSSAHSGRPVLLQWDEARECLICAAADGALIAIDGHQGALLWTVPPPLHTDRLIPEPQEPATELLLSGPRLIQWHQQELRACHMQTGSVQWSQSLPEGVQRLAGSQSGTVLLAGTQLMALDAITGQRRWATAVPETPASGPWAGVFHQGLYVWPTGEELLLLTLRDGKIVDRVAWQAITGSLPGDLLQADLTLLVVRPGELQAFELAPPDRL